MSISFSALLDQLFPRSPTPEFRWLVPAARQYRRILRRVDFIGITGSAGKTTTKELVTAILERSYRVQRNWGTRNALAQILLTTFKTTPWHEVCVQEVSAHAPGKIDDVLRVLQPRIAAITQVALDHHKEYHGKDVVSTKEAIATEKEKLVSCLPRDGCAVLNVDDPLIRAMVNRSRARVITFGQSSDALLRASNVVSSWPERLSFDLHYQNRSRPVQTQLCGTHWVSSVLAALGVSLAQGVSLEEAVGAVQEVPPYPGRMSPVQVPGGVVFIRDDWKCALSTVEPALSFLKNARAKRKIAVIGSLADFKGTLNKAYKSVAAAALDAADKVIFVGRWGYKALRSRTSPRDEKILAFQTTKEASDFLEGYLSSGDLVLLKGTIRVNHFDRIVLARESQIACWSSTCQRHCFCSDCIFRRSPSPDK